MRPLLLLLLLLLSTPFLTAQESSELAQLVAEKYTDQGPGAAILVTKGETVLYRGGAGLANMELNVPMTADHVFEIGSITKQFTAVAILMLAEAGKLNVQDEITKYLPDYPTQGHTITIHHLLNHTSGIKSYTSMNLQGIARTDMSPVEIIDFFKNEPMDFAPGERWLYNNSGYIILGHIIEQVSEQSYEDYVEENIFKVVGMDNSRYGHKGELTPLRASGYQTTEDGFVNAAYLSMTLPYAAGSLMSTVDDLHKWQLALQNNKLISEESKKLAYADGKLNDGKPMGYGYGLKPTNVNGLASIEHGGGIFGYTSYQVYIPESDVHAVVLSNCNCNSPTDFTVRLAAVAAGKPYTHFDSSVELTPEQMQSLVGVYEFEDGALRAITLEEGQLYSQRAGSTKLKIFAVDENTFYFKGGFTKLIFDRSVTPHTVKFDDRDASEAVAGRFTDKPFTTERESVSVAPEILENYVGTYQIQQGFDLVVTLEDGVLMTQATGQAKFALHATTETRFFVKEFAAELEFGAIEQGKAVQVTLFQGGQEIKAPRIDP